jgi:VPDSG-CTERM motif
MKTNSSLRTFKLSTLAPLAIAIGTTLVTQPACAVSIVNNLVITENSNSSTGLTATYNGSTSGVTVSFSGSDTWLVTVTSATFTAADLWQEPEVGFGNGVTAAGSTLTIVSDGFVGSGGVPNGTTVPNFGTDTSNGGSISVTFNDNGDVAAAPDTGTTASLLGLSLASLAFLRRKLC